MKGMNMKKMNATGGGGQQRPPDQKTMIPPKPKKTK